MWVLRVRVCRTGNLKSRVPVGNVHRDAVDSVERRDAIVRNMYAKAHTDIVRAFEAYDGGALSAIDTLFFSAEGDVLHQAIDCMFLGPYSRIEYIVGSPDARLPDLAYFRDNATGQTRDFELPCSGPRLHGDRKGTPFTCGSPARRSVIKSYVRDYLFGGTDANNVTASLITQRLALIERAWRNVSNYGCYSNATRDTSIANCGDPLRGGVGYTPNLPDFTQVNTSEVTAKVMERLPTFFSTAMTNISVWVAHYVDDVHTVPWGKWHGDPAVADFHLYAAHEPIVSYNASEGADASATDAQSALHSPLRNSVWGTCTALLSQPMLTLPLLRYAEDGLADEEGPPQWVPRFVREKVMGEFDPVRTAPREWIDGLLREAWLHSPMYTHYSLRYRPSASMACEGTCACQRRCLPCVRVCVRVTCVRAGAEAEAEPPQRVVEFDDTVFHFASARAGDEPETRVYRHANASQQPLSVPLSRYADHALGAIAIECPCSERVVLQGVGGVDTVSCTFAASVCAQLQHNIERALGLANASDALTYRICADAGGTFLAASIPSVYYDLWLFAANVSCPDQHLTAAWGLFPYDEVERSVSGRLWRGVSPASSAQGVRYDSSDLLASRRMGLSASTLGSVAAQINRGGVGGHYARMKTLSQRDGRGVSLRKCTRVSYVDADASALVDDFFEELFPAAQLVYEPWGASVCTRFVIEHLKHRFLVDVIGLRDGPVLSSSSENLARWRDRCTVKVRQAASCNALGVLHIVPPRTEWLSILPPSCTFPLDENAFYEAFAAKYYVTPGCVLFADGSLYDLHRCRALNASLPLHPVYHLVTACAIEDIDAEATLVDDVRGSNYTRERKALHPLAISHLTAGAGVLHWGSGVHFDATGEPVYRAVLDAVSARYEAVTSESRGFRVDLARAFVHALFDNVHVRAAPLPQMAQPRVLMGRGVGSHAPLAPPSSQRPAFLGTETAAFCGKTFDWWPEDWLEPVAYHPTAACKREHHAFRTFDSHVGIDRDAHDVLPEPALHVASAQAVAMRYHHTLLRNASLLYRYAGAAGLCRLHSVHMPLLQTNVHRVCTRVARTSRNPALPFPRAPRVVLDSLDSGFYEESEQCSESPADTPWQQQQAQSRLHPLMHSVGAVHDLFRHSEPSPARGGRLVTALVFPLSLGTAVAGALNEIPPKSAVFPLAGFSHAAAYGWEGCVPPAGSHAVGGGECAVNDADSCPLGMVCVRMPAPATAGICFPQDPAATGARPCFRSDMCDTGSHCLAEGVCAHVLMHLWNTHDDIDLEFTMLMQGGCGLQGGLAQSFEGASPWEHVPDILRGHGMCAQRHQYAYTYAMAHPGITQRVDDTHAYTAPHKWPWVQQDPSGHILAEDRAQQDGDFMRVRPHVCDRDFMHMPGFSVCSGVRGDPSIALSTYAVQGGAAFTDSSAPRRPAPIAHWFRTTAPNDPSRVLVAPIFATDAYVDRGAFAFLGGDRNAPPESYAGTVGRSQATFTQCTNLPVCGNPPPSFNGREVARLVPSGGAWRPHTAADVISCGQIGYLLVVRGIEMCEFDLAIFPHIRVLAAGVSPECDEIWGATPDPIVVTDITQVCEAGRLCCDGENVASVQCRYRVVSRSSSPSSTQQHVGVYNNMRKQLNAILELATVPESTGARRRTALVATWLTECIEYVAYEHELSQVRFLRLSVPVFSLTCVSVHAGWCSATLFALRTMRRHPVGFTSCWSTISLKSPPCGITSGLTRPSSTQKSGAGVVLGELHVRACVRACARVRVHACTCDMRLAMRAAGPGTSPPCCESLGTSERRCLPPLSRAVKTRRVTAPATGVPSATSSSV